MSSQGMSLRQDPDKPDYSNEAVFRRNTLPPRSYYIPETSLLLNGQWNFHYAFTPLDAPEPSASAAEEWTTVSVPGHWQLQGHGKPQYTNVIYPFPVCPPFVPSENPTGTYRRQFNVPSSWHENSHLRLRFDGVDSAYHVWVNDRLIGYAQGSRNASEFDVTPYVDRHSTNEIFVRVYQWCDGSYIEDQDQWWLSGIFRDVHLISLDSQNRIEDWFLRGDLDSQYQHGILNATITVKSSSESAVKVVIREPTQAGSAAITSFEKTVSSDGNVEMIMSVANAKKWTAETPTLYNVEISLTANGSTQTIHQRLGFRTVNLENGLISVNGKPIRFRGVNRHDHHPLHGRAVPIDFIRKDLLLMKAHNINALRCSHYPSDPRLLDLADELGLWVIDEADLECHGFYDAVARPLNIPEEMDYEERKKLAFPQAAKFTSDNPSWTAAYLDRMEQLIARDKNHTSVIIWSLGNEAFYGRNHQAMYDYAKRVNPGRLVHYEGDPQAKSTDLYSYMYTPVEKLIELAETEGVKSDGSFDKPIILCEYAHAMGNGPGWLEDYERAFQSNTRLQGGFIWEWANHGLLTKDANGKEYYGYGGDFGDEPNDKTFVMDGLLFSTHQPTPGLVELKKVYEPVKVSVEGDSLIVTNIYNFVGLEHLLVSWRVHQLGPSSRDLAIDTGTLDLPPVQPGESTKMALPDAVRKAKTGTETWLTVEFQNRGPPPPWAEANHQIAIFQHQLTTGNPPLAFAEQAPPNSAITTKTVGAKRTFTGHNFSVVFDTATGYITSWESNGKAVLKPDPTTRAAIMPSFWRAPTDNDQASSLQYWQRFGVHAMTSQLRDVTISDDDDNTVTISTTHFLSPPILSWGYTAKTTYKISANSVIRLKTTLTPSGAHPEHVPRVGLNLRLARELEFVEWHGLGPGESYPDKKSAQLMGVWGKKVADLQTNYEVPQENGNRMGTRWVEVNGGGVRLSAMAKEEGCVWSDNTNQDFSFVATRHSAEMLEKAAHPCDLIEEDATFLRLDARVAGVGTAACGPGVREDLLVKVEEMTFGFTLSALSHDPEVERAGSFSRG
ncbi:glycoside hydrolase [Rhypophila decipiens]|uniref:Lactase n=1 Tax=Rhypophila decipiens TaxID=261697 RepID=A0AAN7BBD1_9PEZI|nr:glycoside hydrolase [Rhypophila decipiens]